MKRLVTSFVLFMLLLSVVPAVHAYETPVVSSNKDEHWYINAQRWTDPITSVLEATEDGYSRVECVGDRLIVEQYDHNFQFVSGIEIPLELPIYGGVYLCDDYNFVVVGQENLEEDDTREVFRIIRYSKDWVRQASTSLYGANTTVPFDAGCLRCARSGDILYIRTSHEMYTSQDGLNHQANVMISVRISDMTVTDQLTKIWNSNYGYVSHSFNQFVLVDGDDLLAVDHGDAHPRSVVLFMYGAPAGQETFYSRTQKVNALPIVSSSYHYNDTGVSVGGFEASSTHYLIAGSSADQTETCDLMIAHRNIFVTATPKDDFTDEATTVRWLTAYAEEDDVLISPPHLVKLSSDRFFLIWTENDQIRYCTLDGTGALEGEIRTAEGDLSDCVPVVDDGKVIWYVTDNSEPQFYVIDPDASVHTHSYTAQVTEPTCKAGGYTTYTCSCGDSYVSDYTDALGHDMGEWVVDDPATCTETGTERRDCTRCDHYETRVVEEKGHSYEHVVTNPTCTEKGYTTHTCSVCGDHYVDSYVDELGHEYGEWYVVREATWKGSGEERRDCVRCDHHETRELKLVNPFTDVSENRYYYKPIMWAYYSGITSGKTATTFEPNSTCTRAQVMTFLWAAAGRPEPTSLESPFTDVSPSRYYYKAVLWAVENGITSGTSATTFSPDASCTRNQVVTFLWVYCGRPEPTIDNPFTDVEAGKYYYKPVLWAYENGITTGKTPTTFEPHSPCTRGQIMTFLFQALAEK